MTDEDYMWQAIKAAKESAKKYKHPIGAILVKEDGAMVARGLSMDHNFHAEQNCIHEALRLLGVSELTGCTLFTTQESCIMCFGAALYANIDRLVFGAYADDLQETNTYEYGDFSIERLAEHAARFDGKSMKVTGGVLRDECKRLMNGAEYWTIK